MSHTGQLFFPEDVTDQVCEVGALCTALNIRRTLQSQDGIFNSPACGASMMHLTRSSKWQR